MRSATYKDIKETAIEILERIIEANNGSDVSAISYLHLIIAKSERIIERASAEIDYLFD